MNPQKTSLYIGRFQPFHLGHCDAISQIFERGDTDVLLLGIGSAEENFTPQNPFTAGERFQMIYAGMQELGYHPHQFSILPIRNINHYALWPRHVEQLCPPFSRVFSGSPLVQHLFSEFLPEIEVAELYDRTEISATQVREMIIDEKDLSSVVLESTEDFLHHLGAQKRLQDIQKTSFSEG